MAAVNAQNLKVNTKTLRRIADRVSTSRDVWFEVGADLSAADREFSPRLDAEIPIPPVVLDHMSHVYRRIKMARDDLTTIRMFLLRVAARFETAERIGTMPLWGSGIQLSRRPGEFPPLPKPKPSFWDKFKDAWDEYGSGPIKLPWPPQNPFDTIDKLIDSSIGTAVEIINTGIDAAELIGHKVKPVKDLLAALAKIPVLGQVIKGVPVVSTVVGAYQLGQIYRAKIRLYRRLWALYEEQRRTGKNNSGEIQWVNDQLQLLRNDQVGATISLIPGGGIAGQVILSGGNWAEGEVYYEVSASTVNKR